MNSELRDVNRTRFPDNPVFRDPLPGIDYEVASDGHIFRDHTGQMRMIYTGDHEDYPSIKMAMSQDYENWTQHGTLLSGVGPSGWDANKETAFYRRSWSGQHQIYYIGYPDESTYESQIFMAEAENIHGPYVQQASPVIPKGMRAGRYVYLMTSPSVVEYDGLLYMVYLGWNSCPNTVAEVWSMGAVSEDDGVTWVNIREVDVPIGMEGQITKGPDGFFYTTRTVEYQGPDVEAIYLARGAHPFGPYEPIPGLALIQQGLPWEVNEINCAQLTFDTATGTPYLYYTGADYTKGWWMMLATAPLSDLIGERTKYDLLLTSDDADGWNFVSFNLIPVSASSENILADIGGSYGRIMYFDAYTGRWLTFMPGRAQRYNYLHSWDHRPGW